MIRFRPHHFLCSLGFQGKGYSDDFTANMARIVMGGLRAPGGDDVVIEVVDRTDDICAPCPLRHGTLCESQPKITALDTRHAEALKIASGDQITWGEAKERIVENVPPGGLTRLCQNCRWLSFGMCEGALQNLHDTTKKAAPKDGL